VANLGNIDHGAVLSGYLALLLISAAYISIGIYTSSITQNQIVAFILALFVAFFFQMLFSQMAPMLPGFVGTLVNYLSIGQHFQTMIRGVIDISNVVYLGSLTFLGFILATASIKRRAWA
jgi:ABC-2 type transport system permease protein